MFREEIASIDITNLLDLFMNQKLFDGGSHTNNWRCINSSARPMIDDEIWRQALARCGKNFINKNDFA